MKKIKIMICSLLVLLSGFVFASCGEKKAETFNCEDVIVGSTTFEYNGKNQIFKVSYPGVDVNTTYSVDKNEFKSINDLNCVEVGEYSLYYKISADGYEDLISNEPITFVIEARQINVELKSDYVALIGDVRDGFVTEGQVTTNNYLDKVITYEIKSGNVVNGDDLGLHFKLASFYDETVAGTTLNVEPSYINKNYFVVFKYEKEAPFAKCLLTDNVELVQNKTISYFNDLKQALTNAESGAEIKLNKDIVISESIFGAFKDSGITLTNSITINGNGHTIISNASKGVQINNMFDIEAVDTDANITLKNIIIDGNQQSRAIYINKGILNLENVEIQNGKRTAGYPGGVYVTNGAKANIIDSKIINNNVDVTEETPHLYYSKDVWCGANAVVTISGQSEIGSMFVNANEYSATNPGYATINEGVVVGDVFIEYTKNYGAVLNVNDAVIGNLIVRKNLADDDRFETKTYKEGEIKSGSYVGGSFVEMNGVFYKDIASAIQQAGEVASITLYDDVHSLDLLISNESKNVTLDLNGYNIIGHVAISTDGTENLNFILTNNSAQPSKILYNQKVGVAVKGNEKVDVKISNIEIVADNSNENTTTVGFMTYKTMSGAKVAFENCNISGTYATVLLANDEYNFTNCTLSGTNVGYYAKTGTHTILNSTISATAEYIAPQYSTEGVLASGSAIVIDSCEGYDKTLVVNVNNSVIESVNGYGIEEVATASSEENIEIYALINDSSNTYTVGENKETKKIDANFGVKDSSTNQITRYFDFFTAFANLAENDSIVLYKDFVLESEPIRLDFNFKFKGGNENQKVNLNLKCNTTLAENISIVFENLNVIIEDIYSITAEAGAKAVKENATIIKYVKTVEDFIGATYYADNIVLSKNINSDTAITIQPVSALVLTIDLNGHNLEAQINLNNTEYQANRLAVSFVDSSFTTELQSTVGKSTNNYGVNIAGNDKVEVSFCNVIVAGQTALNVNGTNLEMQIRALNVVFNGTTNGVVLTGQATAGFQNCTFNGTTAISAESGIYLTKIDCSENI